MGKYEITKYLNLPIIIVFMPPFVSWDGLGAKLAADISKLLDEAKSPLHVMVDLSASTATLLQISNAVERHTKADWMRHPSLAAVLVVSVDPEVRKKIVHDISVTDIAPLKFFADRASALRSLGTVTAV